MVVWLYGCTIERDPYEHCILIELWFWEMCLIERYFQGIKIGLCRPPSIYWPPAPDIEGGRSHYCGRAPTFSYPYPHSLFTLPSLPLYPNLAPCLPYPRYCRGGRKAGEGSVHLTDSSNFNNAIIKEDETMLLIILIKNVRYPKVFRKR